VWLSTQFPVVGPKSSSLESEQTLLRNLTGFDTKYAAIGQRLSDDRKDATFSPTVQNECLTHCCHYGVRLQKTRHRILIYQQ
jgi:hypothetical protein